MQKNLPQKVKESRLDWLPWCYATPDQPHPGAYPPIPVGGQGPLISEDRGHLADCLTDFDAVTRWLSRQKDNKNTLDIYRREIERFMLWLGVERTKSLSDATSEDISLYDDLLQAPERWPQWYGPSRPRQHPEWKPWTCKLSARTRHASLMTVRRCYEWLVEVGYLRRNPFDASGIRRKKPQRSAVQERYLNDSLWQAVQDYIHQMPRSTPQQKARYHRARWVIMALYAMLARASEFCQARMSDLVQVRRPTGVQWWWRVRGKHRSEADAPDEVPIPPRLIEELSLYRNSLGLSALPDGDETPMVVALSPSRNEWAPVNRTTLWRIVKDIFCATADMIAEDDHEGAAQLRAASPHWLRHTSVTHRLDLGFGIKAVQAQSRHRSIQDLAIYMHSDRDALYSQCACLLEPQPDNDVE